MNGVIDLPRDQDVNFVLDGGFLNNRPLNLVLEEIFRRPVERETVRKVFFVEPVAEEYQEGPRTAPPEPTALENLWFFKDVPGRQSLAGYLDSVYEHNRRVRHVRDTLETARRMVAEGLTPPRAQRELWIEVRLQALRDQIIDLWQQALGLQGLGGVTVAEPRMARAAFPERLKRANALRVIRTRLLALLENHCEEWTPPPERRADHRATFRLGQIDVAYLDRKIARILDEVRGALCLGEEYGGLYPEAFATGHEADHRGRDDQPETAQEARQRNLASLRPPDRAGIRQHVKQLCVLRDDAQIVALSLGQLVTFLARSPEYRRAAEAAVEEAGTRSKGRKTIDRRLNTLWGLLEGSVTELLTISYVEDPQALTDQIRQKCREICGWLCPDEEAGPEDQEKALKHRRRLIRQSRKPPGDPVSLVSDIDDRINQHAKELADLLRHVPGSRPLALPDLRCWWTPRRTEREIGSRIEALDIHLFPIERAADLVSLADIELVHVSARDIQLGFSQETAANKLAGDVLANLGGFLKRSWRVNDLLWGRLDASGAILEALLDRDRLARLLTAKGGSADPDRQDRTAWNMLAALDSYLLEGAACQAPPLPTNEMYQLPPPLPREVDRDALGRHLMSDYLTVSPAGIEIGEKSVREEIWAWLKTVSPKSLATREDNAGLLLMREWILRRHQLEILQEEVPQVLAEALSEHGEWQGESGTVGFTAALGSLSFATAGAIGRRAIWSRLKKVARVSGASLDTASRWLLRENARDWVAEQLAMPASSRGGSGAARPEPDPARVERFFRRDYRMGEETILEDVPALVTLERTVRALLIGLHVLTNSLSPRFRNSPLGIRMVATVLRPLSLVTGGIYGFVSVVRQGRSAASAVHAVAWSCIVLATAMIAFHLTNRADLPHPFWVAGLVVGGIALGCEVLWSWLRPTLHASAWTLLAIVGLMLFFNPTHAPQKTSVLKAARAGERQRARPPTPPARTPAAPPVKPDPVLTDAGRALPDAGTALARAGAALSGPDSDRRPAPPPSPTSPAPADPVWLIGLAVGGIALAAESLYALMAVLLRGFAGAFRLVTCALLAVAPATVFCPLVQRKIEPHYWPALWALAGLALLAQLARDLRPEFPAGLRAVSRTLLAVGVGVVLLVVGFFHSDARYAQHLTPLIAGWAWVAAGALAFDLLWDWWGSAAAASIAVLAGIITLTVLGTIEHKLKLTQIWHPALLLAGGGALGIAAALGVAAARGSIQSIRLHRKESGGITLEIASLPRSGPVPGRQPVGDPFDAVPEDWRRPLFGTLVAVMLLIALALSVTEVRLWPHTIVAFELAGSRENIYRVIAAWKRVDAVPFAAFNLGLGFLYIVVYSTTLAMACTWAARLLGRRWLWIGEAGKVLAWLQWLAGLLAAGEKTVLLTLLFASLWHPPLPFSPQRALLPALAQGCAVLKFSLIGAAGLYCIVAAALWFVGGILPHRKPPDVSTAAIPRRAPGG